MPLLIFSNALTKSYVAAHTRRLKNGKVVQVQAYSDKRLRKDAQAVTHNKDITHLSEDDRATWERLHKEQHVLHHIDKAKHERRIKEATEAIAHHQKKAAYHEEQRDLARANGDSAALSEHNKALTHHHNQAQSWANKRAPHERQLAKVNNKLEGIKALKEKLWEGSGEVASTGNVGSTEALFAIAMSRKDGNKAYAELGGVTPEVAQKVRQAANIDITGFVHTIDEAAIRHIIKQHGNEKTEKARGQVAVTADDINHIKAIVDSPDEVAKGETLDGGIETVIYKKTVGNTSSYVQEIRKGKGRLAAKTLWKTHVARDVLQDESPALRPKTFNALSSPQGNSSIAQTDKKASQKFNDMPIEGSAKELGKYWTDKYRNLSGTDKDNEIKRHQDNLNEYKKMKQDLANKLITPRSVVGTGYKDSRKAANMWLDKMINHAESAISLLTAKAESPEQSPPKITPTGKDNEVKTAKGTKINTQFAVVEASDLITSHDANGNANAAYPQELQPRNRGRDTSQAQITRMAKNLDPDMLGRTRNAASGAPIVGNDGIVESGNGRTLAIHQAYQTGNADDYRDWLENEAADAYGLDAKQIKGMKNPVLVRVRTSDIDRAQFAREANQSDMLAMTATEKAKADAAHLTEAVMDKLSIDGDLSSTANRNFVMSFMAKLGDDESAGLTTTDGKPTKALYDRVQAAIFAKAYNDDRLLELMADEAKPEIANIIKSLNQAAPSFIKARALSEHHAQSTTGKLVDAVDVSIDKQAIDAIIKATEALKKAKEANMPIDKLIDQADLFGGIDPVVGQMALFIKDNNRSTSRMGEAFTAMADYLVSELTNQQNASLFDDDKPITMMDVLKAANNQLQAKYGDKAKTIGGGQLGGFIDLFTETRGQKTDRERFLAKSSQKPLTKSLNTGHPLLLFRKAA